MKKFSKISKMKPLIKKCILAQKVELLALDLLFEAKFIITSKMISIRIPVTGVMECHSISSANPRIEQNIVTE